MTKPRAAPPTGSPRLPWNPGLRPAGSLAARVRVVGDGPTRRLLGWYAASRLLTVLVAILVGLTRPGQAVTRFLSAWDGGWYLEVVSHGYPSVIPEIGGRATESTIAFFPLYPLLVRG